MATFLSRYLAGERTQVWEELQGLGESVRVEPLYSDALAVAQETMSRARFNIELLISRLTALDYQFGYGWWERFDPHGYDAYEAAEHPPMFAPPKHDVAERIAELEALVGAVPISLRSWYEHIGAVNLVGIFPAQDATRLEGFTSWVQFLAEHPDFDLPPFQAGHDLDPLYVAPIEAALHSLRTSAAEAMEIEIAPDEWLKYAVSGGGPYSIRVPNAAADAPLEHEWHNTSFVNYLRICFEWGGFPGLEPRIRRPDREIDYLTADLLPI